MPGNGVYARVPPHVGGAQPMTPIQTQLSPMYEYQAMQAMTAIPYSPLVEQFSTLGMVSLQL